MFRIAAALLSLALALPAAAQEIPDNNRTRPDTRTTDTAPITKDNWPHEVLRRPLTYAQGLFELNVPVEINLSTDSVGQPVNLPLRLWYGVTDRFTLGVTHAIGLCVSGTSNGCPKAYNDLSVQGRLALVPTGALQAALIGVVALPSLSDPFASALGIGVDVRQDLGDAFAVRVAPQIFFGLNNRDSLVATNGTNPAANRETLIVPIALQYQATRDLFLDLNTEVHAQLDPPDPLAAGDTVVAPLGLSATVALARMFDVGASFRFLNLFGHHAANVSASDERQLELFVNARF